MSGEEENTNAALNHGNVLKKCQMSKSALILSSSYHKYVFSLNSVSHVPFYMAHFCHTLKETAKLAS